MLQPLHDYVLLKREKEEKTTASGIILTSGKEKSKLAVVAAIGSGVKDCEYALNDKVLYKEEDNITYLVVVDYKTGSTNINLKNMEYGLGLQLPIYLYLSNKMELKNIKVVGFYLQKLFTSTLDNSKDYETTRENNLRLEGYSTDNENILSKFDTTYNDSKLIKGMKTTSKGFSTYSKVLNDEELDSMINNTDKLINEGIDKILEGDFTINPKVIDGTNVSCSFCEYRDICYLREKDITYINREEDKDGEDV